MTKILGLIVKRVRKSVKGAAGFPLHPFVMAIFPVLFLYSRNMREVFINSTFLPTLAILFITILVLFVLKLIFRDLRKVAIQVSFLLLLVFSYGHVVSLTRDFDLKIIELDIFQDDVFFYAWVIIALLGSFFILKILEITFRKSIRIFPETRYE